MVQNINLLPSKGKRREFEGIERWLIRLAAVSLVVFILALIGLLVASSMIVLQQNALVAYAGQAKSTIAQNQDKESLYLLLYKKIGYLDNKIAQRLSFASIVHAIRTVNPGGIRINSLSIANDGKIRLSVVATSVDQLESFITGLLTNEIIRPYVITISKTSRNKDGSYDLDMELAKPSSAAAVEKKATTQTQGKGD